MSWTAAVPGRIAGETPAVRKITIGSMSASDNAFRLDGKIALVTGSGRGIGRAIALALAAAGAEVILNSRTPAELDAVAAEITGRDGRARVLPFDVTDSAAVRVAIGGLTPL